MNYAIQARWLIPIDRPPIAGGMISVAEGRIVAVGENSSGRPPIDLGDVALLPGFVNAHTHLEFSLLEKPLGTPRMPFADWIVQVISWRRSVEATFAEDPQGLVDNRRTAIAAGLAESHRAGVAAVGEIAMPGGPIEAYSQVPGIGVVALLELLSRAEDRAQPLMELAASHVAAAAAAGLYPGLSPHATYSVHPHLLRRACEMSAAEQFPVAMHIAESQEELQLLREHRGPLVDLLVKLNAWNPSAMPRGARPLDFVETLQNAHRALIIHGNYLAADEIDYIAGCRDHMSIVYCPRTHAYFGHEPYPLMQMLAAGARVAIGTDSRASNPDLSVLAELRFIAQRRPRPRSVDILVLGTLAPAEALGIESDYGSIAVGKRAAFAAVPIFERRQDPIEQVLHNDMPAFGYPSPNT